MVLKRLGLFLGLFLLLRAGEANATIAIDGSTGSNSGATASSFTLTLTTSQTNDIIVVANISNNGGALSPAISSISDVAGLSWSKRSLLTLSCGGGCAATIEYWTAKSPSTLSSDVITVNLTNASQFRTSTAFGISGITVASYFDPHSGLPLTENTSPALQISTTNADDIILGFYRMSSTATPSAGTGFTAIYNPSGGYFLSEYKVVSSPQTNLTVGLGGGATDQNGGIADALTTDISPAPHPGMLPIIEF